jgi:hypothetical protein
VPNSKKTNFSEGDAVDINLDGMYSSQLAVSTPSTNNVAAEFEIYLNSGAGWYGPVDLVDPKDRTTPLASLVGASKSGQVDCAGYSQVRIKRKVDGAGGAAQAAYWSITVH